MRCNRAGRSQNSPTFTHCCDPGRQGGPSSRKKMQAASLAKIRKELKNLPPEDLIVLVNRLARYKKENKELLSYLLFESIDEQGYIDQVKRFIESEFETINVRNLYWARKGIRRILRLTNKHIKYSGLTSTEIELRAHFCRTLRDSGIPIQRSAALSNLYDREVERIEKAIKKLHEDERMDFAGVVEELG